MPEVRDGLDKGLAECTLEFDHGIRHRMNAKSPRALAKPLAEGVWNSSFPIVFGKPSHQITASQPCEQAKNGWTFVVLESRDDYQHIIQHFIKLALNNAKQYSIQRRGDLAQTWGVVLMLPNDAMHRFAARGLLTLNSPLTRVSILQASNKYLKWPTSSTRHTSVYHILRKPLFGNIEKLVNKVKNAGFINYCSLPSRRKHIAPTAIGAAILQKDWKAAITFLMLRGAVSKTSFVRQGYGMWSSGASKEVLKDYFKRRDGTLRSEWYSYMHMVGPEKERDYFAAYSMHHVFPKYEALRFIQQHIWNYMTSMRISLFGLKVAPGDLVMDVTGAVYPISEGQESQYTIYDVVLPLVPFPYHKSSVKYPGHVCGENLVEEVLSDFGVSLSDFESDSDLQKELEYIFTCERESSEAYRHLVVRPKNLTCEVTNTPLDKVELGRFNAGEVVPPDENNTYLVIKADIPSTSDMQSLTREIILTQPDRESPISWQMAPLRMGAMIHPEDEPLGAEEIEALKYAANNPQISDI